MKVAVGWLLRARSIFNKDLPSWLEIRANKLPPYRTNTILIIANVSLRFLYDFTKIIILTICISTMIATGNIMGIEQGGNFIKIETNGWGKKDDDKQEYNSLIYDIFDLRYPQIENGALFLTTNIIKSPVQTRFEGNEQTPSRCFGSDDITEKCKLSIDCHSFPFYTKNGIILKGSKCEKEGYCLINSWCNQYHWFCKIIKLSFKSKNQCHLNCPQITECIDIYKTTNSSLMIQENQFIINGLQDWLIRFDIFMTFDKYYIIRNIVNIYYQNINIWKLSTILTKLDTNYDKIKENGIIIAVNGAFKCTLFSLHCNSFWQFSRLDNNNNNNNKGFKLSHRKYIPGVTLFLNNIKSMESRYIFEMRGIRILANISSTLFIPDPMAALISIGGIIGLLSISNILTNIIMMRFVVQPKKYQFYKNSMELNYNDLVKQEKEQIKASFDIAITKHMKILYQQEKDIKRMLDLKD